jgi:hypothetical protein
MSFTAARWAKALAWALALALAPGGPVHAAPADPAAAVVARLYKDYGWQAFALQDELFGEDIAHQGQAVLERYFSRELAGQLNQDAECQQRERGICRLDFDILFDSQDPAVADLEVQLLARGKVQVRFANPKNGEATVILFLAAPTDGQWRITDVLYGARGERSLKRLLQQR